MNKVVIILVLIILSLGIFAFFANKQNSAPAAQTSTTNNIENLAENLEIPWEMAALPNGDILLTERPGRVRIIKDGKLQETPVLALNDVAHVGEGGLLGITLHPNFKDQFGDVYLYYTSRQGSNLFNKVVQYEYSETENAKLTFKKVIIENIPGNANHDGGRIKFGPDGKLYITTGDAGQESLSQDKNSLAGKILRLNDDGTIPEDNPFKTAIYSYGHRNPEGLAWDNTGQLWSTEHGSKAFDEVNKIEAGKNYGWPTIRGDQEQEGMEKPFIHSGDSTWAPSGMMIKDGQIYFTGLRGAAIFKLDPQTKKLERFFEGEFGRLRAVAFLQDSFLVLTSNRDGRGVPKQNDDRIIKIKQIN